MENTERQPYTFDRVIRIFFTVIGVGGAIYVLNLLKGALLPFLVAWLLAYLLDPLVQFFQFKMRIKNRLAAIFATLLSIGAVLTLLGFVCIPSIISEIDQTAKVIQQLPKSEEVDTTIVHQTWYETLLHKVDFNEIGKLIKPDEWKSIAESTLKNFWSVLTASLNQILTIAGWLIVILYLIFILLDYNRIIEGFKRLIPQKYREITLTILHDVEQGMNRYFRGQSLIALLVGIGFSIGFVLIGLPLAIPLGLFIGLLNLVPYLQVVGLIPTVLLCWLTSYSDDRSFWMLFGLAMIVFAVVQTIQDAIITPRIMGKVTGLNPAVILLSLSVWGSLMGMMGMIIALPLTTLLLSYYKRYILKDKEEIENSETPEAPKPLE